MVPTSQSRALATTALTACPLRASLAAGLRTKSPRPKASLLVVLGIAADCCLGWPADAQQTVPDAPSCPSCTIVVRPVTVLRSDAPSTEVIAPPNAVRRDSRHRYWVLPSEGPPIVFDSAGRPIRSIGRRGSGPAEFVSAVDALVLPGDSVLIIDQMLRRATVISPDLTPARSVDLLWPLSPAIVLGWPRALVMNGNVRTPDGAGLPLHFVSLAGRQAAFAGSFSPGEGTLLPGKALENHQLLALSTGGNFWSAYMLDYQLALWSPKGRLLASLKRRPAWFPSKSPYGVGNPSTPPPPALVSIEEDTTGMVWVFARVASRSWRQGWTRVRQGAKEVASQDIALEQMFWTEVEVINPLERRVVARTSLNEWVLGSMGNGLVATYTTDQGGSPVLSIRHVSLQKR